MAVDSNSTSFRYPDPVDISNIPQLVSHLRDLNRALEDRDRPRAYRSFTSSNIKAVEGDYQVLVDDSVLIVTTVAADVVLPGAKVCYGLVYTVKAAAPAGVVTLTAQGSVEIDSGLTGGGATITINSPDSVRVQSDGERWWKV